jgi:hypothetical protein
MILSPFDRPGRFWRGNLHCHSTRSDGALPPDEVARRYQAQGYDFYCQSDHFMEQYGFPITDTAGFRSDGFTTLLAAELHAPSLANGEIWHILGVGLPADFAPPAPGETGPDLARRAQDAGAFVAIAHPQWYGLTLEDARTVAFADAIEVYNHTCAVQADRPDGTYLLDQMLLDGLHVNAIATDDEHFRDLVNSNADAFGGWVMVRAEVLTPEAILAALKAGAFYATQGPDLHLLSITGGRIEVRCSAVDRITVLGPRARSATLSGPSMTAASLPLDDLGEDWLRVVLVDRTGRRCWSNPIRLTGAMA